MSKFNSALLVTWLLIGTCPLSRAGSATWKSNAASGDWNTATNWTPNTVPNGPGDTATFAVSQHTAISISANVEVSNIVFGAGASAYTIAPSPGVVLTLSGPGITNNSGITQNFVPENNASGAWGVVSFTNAATAGVGVTFVNPPGIANFSYGGEIDFSDSATAGFATFTNSGGTIEFGYGGLIHFSDNASADHGTFTSIASSAGLAEGGQIYFRDTSSAGHATFDTKGGVAFQSIGALTWFYESSTAEEATMTTEGGAGPGETLFLATSTVGNSTQIAADSPGEDFGGLLRIYNSSTGGTARVEVFGNGQIDTTTRDTGHGKVIIGSLEGDGMAVVRDINFGGSLIVGSNNLSTVFAGTISSGRLGKIGSGALTLTGANGYDGPTIVRGGKLLVNNVAGSATGTGLLRVDIGALGGNGIISGPVTIGAGQASRALLAPGVSGQGVLTTQNTLTFGSNGAYNWSFDAGTQTADEAVSNGVTIDPEAAFSPFGSGTGTLGNGTVFTAISNTSANPISGTFSNLPDGGVISVNGNNFQVSYEGGDGNDLTLTVVP
ncbi:MAG: autotransporter-associated beta strand repeat-containing protein [Chthoniobacterales bacterium]|nr:autotransporter-associated beta strand repeat-containing protein [Chthoniobacterales bacterium]